MTLFGLHNLSRVEVRIASHLPFSKLMNIVQNQATRTWAEEIETSEILLIPRKGSDLG